VETDINNKHSNKSIMRNSGRCFQGKEEGGVEQCRVTLTQAARKGLSQEVLVKLKFEKLVDASQGEGGGRVVQAESSMFADPRVGGSMAFTRS